MIVHANAKLGLAGRLALVRAIDRGSPRPAPRTSRHSPTHPAGTAKPNASSAPSKTNQPTPTP